MPRFRPYHDQKGVTLIEALLAMAVFALALSLILGIMNNSLRQQRKVSAEQLLAGNTRDVIEEISREIRLDSVDYERHLIQSSPDNLTGPIAHLYLKNNSGDQLSFEQNGSDVELNGAAINSDSIDIDSLAFYIRPTSDPFFIKSCATAADCNKTLYPVKSATCLGSGICDLENVQPRVTVVISAKLRGITDPDRQSAINLQTTVITRSYKR